MMGTPMELRVLWAYPMVAIGNVVFTGASRDSPSRTFT